MYAYVYVYVHMHISICTYICIHIYKDVYAGVCVYTCVYMYICTCLYLCMCTLIYMMILYMHIDIDIYVFHLPDHPALCMGVRDWLLTKLLCYTTKRLGLSQGRSDDKISCPLVWFP